MRSRAGPGPAACPQHGDSAYLSHSEAVVKSVISNTSDSGCGETAGEAVSGEAAAGRERWGWTGRDGAGREERENTHFAVRRHLALRPPHAQRLAGRSGCLIRRLIFTERLVPARRLMKG